MKFYTYKVTFEDLPHYFYYGYHKDNGKPYLGSPHTWKHLWEQFEPKIEILQWFENEKDAQVIEKKIIAHTWNSKFSLNENVGGILSFESRSKGGKKAIQKINSEDFEVRSKWGKMGGSAKSEKQQAARSKVGKKFGSLTGLKPVEVTDLKTGEIFTFKSMTEACKELGLLMTGLSQVVNGTRKSHKGYFAQRVK
jgi:hypothetical protein